MKPSIWEQFKIEKACQFNSKVQFVWLHQLAQLLGGQGQRYKMFLSYVGPKSKSKQILAHED